MIDRLKRLSSKARRYTIAGSALGIIVLPSFVLDAGLSAIILALTLLGNDDR